MSKAVIIGRFQGTTEGHVALFNAALSDVRVTELIVLVGSANKCRSVRNPFTFEQRKQVIEDVIKTEIGTSKQITILPLNDYLYQQDKWETEVREKARGAQYIFGYEKDASSFYLRVFPEMKFVSVPPFSVGGKVVNATDIREDLFNEPSPESAINLAYALPESSFDFLMQYVSTEEFKITQEEYRLFQKEKKQFAAYPYPGSLNCCTGDSVVVCQGHVLLITRKAAPGKGLLALPGGHKNNDETFRGCALRELMEETRLKVPLKVIEGSIVEEKLFDHPDRSQNMCKPTLALHINIRPDADGSMPKVKPADDAIAADWYPLSFVKENMNLFFDDHAEIISYFGKL